MALKYNIVKTKQYKRDCKAATRSGLDLEKLELVVRLLAADIALPPRTAILGELSLTGEVRPVNRLDKRIQECARLGFSHIVVPNSDTLPKIDGLNYTRVKNIREALCILGI